ncbi:MAG: hypothetical protein KDB40_00830 [Acidimicrobiales bacterium]|nr:hypothetical protein [Acidimicrobiales bacterium]MCB9395037.1 hypothetical protein [Acidimicrobiaceae bacterium]
MNTAAVTSSAVSSVVSDGRIARRLAVLLTERRRQAGLGLRALAKTSDGAFSAKELKLIEAAKAPLTRDRAEQVARLYGVDLTSITPDRMPLEIDPRGVVSTGGSAISFDPDDAESLLASYLKLVRTLRGQERSQAIELRRNDVDVLALYLELPGELVVERLATLMGATQLQRRVLAGMFVAGAMVIGLSAAAAANLQAAEHRGSSDPGARRAELDWRD